MSKNDSNQIDLLSTANNIENLLTALLVLSNYHHVDSSIRDLISKLISESENLNCIVSLSKAIPKQAIEMGLLRGLPLDVRPHSDSDSSTNH